MKDLRKNRLNLNINRLYNNILIINYYIYFYTPPHFFNLSGQVHIFLKFLSL